MLHLMSVLEQEGPAFAERSLVTLMGMLPICWMPELCSQVSLQRPAAAEPHFKHHGEPVKQLHSHASFASSER